MAIVLTTDAEVDMWIPNFAVFGAIGLLCLVFTLIWVPETKGKSLERIEQELRARVAT
ncbi:MFS transporter [Kineosporia sp. J2-2]|uniref:MFS transporter n=1 Tax=Kineosporia corallincola TaxID=2835133 RepID=A0ABS5T8S9_9ACTN|nr:MFS transporter [Kineosporia corallincola]